MKNKIIGICVCMLLTTSFVGISQSLSNTSNPQKTMNYEENDNIISSDQNQSQTNLTYAAAEQINTTLISFTDLQTNWNMISIPNTEPINKTEIYVRYNNTNFNWTEATSNNNPTGGSLIDKTIFTWNRTTQTYLVSNTLTPGDGNWMYSHYNLSLMQTLGLSSTDSNDTYSYIIYTRGNLFYAKNGKTGIIEKTSNLAAETFTYAITHLPANGGEIFVKAGTYMITYGLPIVQGLCIIGEGPAATFLEMTNTANCPMFSYNGSTDIYFFTLEHLQIMCQTGSTAGSCIKTNTHVNDGLIFDVYITHFKEHGLDLGTTWGWRIQGIFEYMGGDGVHLHGGANAYITNSKIDLNEGNGINLDGSGMVTITGNYISKSGKNGVLFNNTASCTFTGNVINTNDKYKTGLYSDIYVTANSKNNVIVGNLIYGGGCSKYNIYLAGTGSSTKNIVLGNIMSSAVSGTIYCQSSNTDLIKTNQGYTTENYGICTITNSNAVIVNHGLSTTPKAISITPTGKFVSYYVDSVTATQFTLHINQTSTVSCYWTVFA